MMTRNLITEIVIRLLGIWLFIENLSYLLFFWHTGSGMTRYENYGASLILPYLEKSVGLITAFIIAVLIIKYSGPITNFIWKDKGNDDELLIKNNGSEIATAIVAIVGLYLSVSVLSKAISELVKFAILSPEYTERIYLRDTMISGLCYELILFLFGLYLFTRPERIINLRNKLRREPIIADDESE